MAMRMGATYKNDVILGIDIDTDPSVKSAEELRKIFKKDYGMTPYCRTKSGGYHYLLKVNDEYFSKDSENPFSNTDGKIFKFRNKEYRVDLKCHNQILYTAPTVIDCDGEEYKYELLVDLEEYQIPENFELEHDLLIQIKNIYGHYDKKSEKPKPEENSEESDDESHKEKKLDNGDILFEKLDFIYKHLSISRCDEYKNWVECGMILRNEFGNDNHNGSSQGYKIWKKFSRRSKKHKLSSDQLKTKWDSFKYNPNDKNMITMGTALYWLKMDDIYHYEKYWDRFSPKEKYGDTFNKDVFKSLQFNEDKIRYFNHYHAYVINSSYYLKISYKNNVMQDIHIFKKTELFKDAYNNLKCTVGNDRNYSFVKYWRDHDLFRTYEDVIFYPGKDNKDDYFNLAKQMSISYIDDEELTPEEKKSYKMIDKLLYELCGHEEASKEYVKNWLAQLVQHPEIKPGVALLFMSMMGGVGKNLFWQELIGKRILGKGLYNYASNIHQMVGRFNTNLAYKLLTVCDEINNAAFNEKDFIKTLITSTEINYEKKSIDSVIIDDYNRFVFLTNNIHSILTEKDERRFMIIESSIKLKGDDKFFETFTNEILKNNKIIKHFYNELFTRDISNYKMNNKPATKYQKEMEMMSQSVYLKSISHNYEKYAGNFIQIDQLVEDTLFYCDKYKLSKMHINHIIVGKECGIYKEIMRPGRGGKSEGRPRGFKFEDIKTLKKYFDK